MNAVLVWQQLRLCAGGMSLVVSAAANQVKLLKPGWGELGQEELKAAAPGALCCSGASGAAAARLPVIKLELPVLIWRDSLAAVPDLSAVWIGGSTRVGSEPSMKEELCLSLAAGA